MISEQAPQQKADYHFEQPTQRHHIRVGKLYWSGSEGAMQGVREVVRSEEAEAVEEAVEEAQRRNSMIGSWGACAQRD